MLIAKQHKKPVIGILGGNYAYDPVLSNVMPWFSNKIKFHDSKRNLQLTITLYMIAIALILSWFFGGMNSQAVLYVMPAVLIFNTAWQQLLNKSKTATR